MNPSFYRNCFCKRRVFYFKQGGRDGQSQKTLDKGIQKGVSFHVICQFWVIIWTWLTVFSTFGCHFIICAMSWHQCDLDTIASAPQYRRHPQEGAVQIWEQSDWQFLRYWHFCVLPPVFLIWPSETETWPQNWYHSSSSPNLPKPQLTPLLVH